MHVGLAVALQNPAAAGLTDLEMYQNELRLVDRAEELGFESIWATEHHFTDYQVCPDVFQFLAYAAGRAPDVELGSMVVVLPWHDPVLVAEKVSMLDNMTGGKVVLGIGRGLGRIEFEGLRIPMDESRERFVESAELILESLESGTFEYDGTFFRQPRRDMRPAPFKTFRGRTYAAAVSPESSQIMAKLGVGILLLAQKPWDTVVKDLASYRETFREVNGIDAPPTVAGGFVFCDEDEDRAKELGERYISAYYHSVLDHYELAGAHFAGTGGYGYYEKMSGVLNKHGDEKSSNFFADLQVYGTPDQCYEKILRIRETVGCDRFIGFFSYAGMPMTEVHRNMELFSDKVMPRIQALRPEDRPPVAPLTTTGFSPPAVS